MSNVTAQENGTLTHLKLSKKVYDKWSLSYGGIICLATAAVNCMAHTKEQTILLSSHDSMPCWHFISYERMVKNIIVLFLIVISVYKNILFFLVLTFTNQTALDEVGNQVLTVIKYNNIQHTHLFPQALVLSTLPRQFILQLHEALCQSDVVGHGGRGRRPVGGRLSQLVLEIADLCAELADRVLLASALRLVDRESLHLVTQKLDPLLLLKNVFISNNNYIFHTNQINAKV